MTELTPTLRNLRALCREVATDLRDRALAVDSDPDAMAPHLDSPALALVRNATTPARFRRDAVPYLGDDATATCLERVVATVELARGDAAMLVANPGPSLAGIVVDALGSDAQRELFYDAIADGRTWTFFAMTEEERGSDATALASRLDRDGGGHLLHGAKRYISNGTRGGIGVVFARTGPSPLSIRAALVRRPSPGLTGQVLDMTGLRGARISALAFDAVPVPAEHLLGSHLPASRRGLWGASRTFNAMRVQIGALALGVAYAAHDYVRTHRPGIQDTVVTARLDAARALLYSAADAVDHVPDDRRSPSVAKLHATDLAIRLTHWAAAALGPGSLLEHPLLEKWSRDVHAFEFMDGTSNILRLHIASAPDPAGRNRP
ncbi:acyl-CoA dehydrogenase family protein [Streptomyces sp. TBY4]|uniref:acyl-CoA dehydrogenase family protein n=1 Tax=Streptomyces sp. TBY4 TaxID=2962030 RepID=UPI0020B779C1|nr:acyl-CoA dehydrogenase [Streptomyces sp. TBY4]MCP3760523.1 acyl-CoA dehydrogenase [Streptomyces sp. TBY4]